MDRESVANAFLRRYLGDLKRGRVLPLEVYQRDFPGHEELVARHYSELQGEAEEGADVEDEEVHIGPYRLLYELGRGGQGVVHLAHDPRLGRRVALKVLSGLAAISPDRRARFVREATVASRLDHPAICTVYETGIADGLPYIAMRFVEGETLAESIAKARDGDGSLQLGSASTSGSARARDRAVVMLIEEVARAAHVAHEAGVLHRDLKPGNVIVTPEGRPVILDFGLARFEEEGATLTRSGEVLGTPAYMAPEQLRAERRAVDRRADVWALGVTLQEALTLRRPFEAPTREALVYAVLQGEPDDPRGRRPDLPRDLRTVLQTTLEKDPRRRYHTALDLAEDLRRFLDSEPIAARPPSTGYRLRKFCSRHKAPVAGTLAVVLALVAGMIGTSLQASRAKRAESAALRREGIAHEVAAVLQRILASADPSQHKGKDYTVREALDEAAADLETHGIDDPAVELPVRMTLGRSYLALGLYDEAEPHVEQAVELARTTEECTEEEIGEAIAQLGYLRHEQGRYDDAEPLLREGLDHLRRAHGDVHENVVAGLTGLGSCLWRAGRRDEGRACIEEAVALGRQLEGDVRAELLHALNEASFQHYQLGELEPSRAGMREALALASELHGEDHLMTAKLHSNLGAVLVDLGVLDEAERHVRAALEVRRERLEADHPDVASTMLILAQLLGKRGQGTESVALYREIVAIDVARFGPDHPYVAFDLGHLGDELRQLGCVDEAIRVQRACLAIQAAAASGPDDPGVLAARHNLALTLKASGEFAVAEELFRQVLAARQRDPNVGARILLKTRANLARLVHQRGRLDEAELRLRDTLADQIEAFGEDDGDALVTRSNLALCLADRAERAAKEEALRLAEEVLAARRGRFGDDDPLTLLSWNVLGGTRLHMGRLAGAEEALLAAHAGRRRVLGAGAAPTLQTQSDLALLYALQGRHDEAERLAREALQLAGGSHGTLALPAVLMRSGGDLGEAEAAARAAVEEGVAREHPETPATTRARLLHVEILLALGRTAEAERSTAAALEVARTYAAGHAVRVRAGLARGRALAAVGRGDEAEPLLREGHATLEAALGTDHPDVSAALRALEELLEGRGAIEASADR